MKKLLLTAILAFVSIFASRAQSLDLMQVIPNDPDVRVGTLESGIKYYIRANKKDPQRANFHIVYDVGAIQEEDRQDGLAHFLEHMAFNGSKHFPDNSMIEYLETIGVKFGENLNAGTGQQTTTYMITDVPVTRQGIVDSVLLILHDWAGFISLNEDDIDKERGVIQEEFRLYEGMADQRVMRKKTQLLFGQDNIYARRDIIGSLDNLKNFTYQDIRDFYHKWYRPDMQAFVIVGDFDVDQMEAKLKQTMADIKEFDVKTPKQTVVVPDNEQPRVAVISDPELTTTAITLTYRHRPIAEKYNNRLFKQKNDLINMMISSMLNQRLSEVAKGEGAPFQRSGAYYEGYYTPFDMFALSTTAREGEAIKAFTAAYTELLRMKRSGFVLAEFDRQKANMLSDVEKSYTNRADRRNAELTSELMDNFLENEPYPSAEVKYELGKQLIQSITLDELNAQSAALVTDKNIVLSLTAPKKDNIALPTEAELLNVLATVAASQIDPYTEEINTKPLLDASKLKGSAVVKTESGKFESTVWTLKNGIKVVVKPTKYKADEILLNAFKKGGMSTVASLEDLRSMSLYPNFENVAGIADFSDTELTRLLTGKNVSLSPVFDLASVGYRGNSTIKDFETMLQLNYLYATAPRFNEKDWAVMIDKVSTSIKGSEKNPMHIFQDSMSKSIYAHNPRMSQLSLETLSTVSMERMRNVYNKFFGSADGMTFVITGSVDPDTIKPLIEKYIGSLPVAKTKKAPQVGPYIPEPFKGNVENMFVTKQEAGRVISCTVYNGSVDYSLAESLNLDVAGQVLQYGYTRNIREAKGGAYIAQNAMTVSAFPKEMYVNVALFMTDSSKLNSLLPEIQKGVDTLVNNGPSTVDLTKAKEAMAKQFAERNSLNSAWLSYLTSWYLIGNDNYTNYLEELGKVNAETVKKAAKRAFDQGNRLTLVQQP